MFSNGDIQITYYCGRQTHNHTAVLLFPLRDSHCKIVKCAVYRFKHLLDDSVIFEFWQKSGHVTLF